MTELIDKNAQLDRFKKAYEDNKEYSVANGLAMAYDMIQGQPTVKAIPVEDILKLYNAAVAYRDRFKPYSDNWIAANDQAIGVRSVLDMWEGYL